jgi:hypothetical protein
MTIKSPFLVYQNFLSSTDCDQLAQTVRVELLKNDEGVLQPVNRFHEEAELEIFDKFQHLIPEIEEHFGVKYRGTEHLVFQQFPVSNQNAEEPHCENAVFKRKKWLRVKDRDLTGILWLKDYQESPPFNIQTQVLGGKLEFPVYNFGFQPQKGTLIVYPSCERFISLTTPILVGELQCVRFHICGEGFWLYDPEKFKGDFRTWFSDIV